MTFASKEGSRAQGVPIEVYLFVVRDEWFGYTNADDPITREENVNGVFRTITYQPVPITRNNITASGALDRSTLTVSIADDVPLCALLRGYPLSDVITLRIRQGHLNDPDAQFLVAWAGRVLSSKGGNGERQITCQPVSTSLRRLGLRRNWQYACPHVLYGDRCRADRPRATRPAVVQSQISGVEVRVNPGFTDSPREWFLGGLLVCGGEVRTILNIIPLADYETVIIGGKINLAIGDSVDLVFGCDHQVNFCRVVHAPRDEVDYGGGNIRNYGGMPFIPTSTPIGFVSNFG